MFSRNAIFMAVCASVLGGLSLTEQAQAQGAPFTIRKPPDGSTVREKVKVEIPRASIAPGGFVAIYLDGKFYVAVPPDEEHHTNEFTWVWDTKQGVSDGPHSIRTVLYEPTPDSTTAVTPKGSSEVKITVANKITNGPSSLRLRYKLTEGQNLLYDRTSTSKIVGGVSYSGTSSDQTMASIVSSLLIDIESPAPLALVRNKLMSLAILQGGREVSASPSQLSASMYQELDPQGEIHYEYGTLGGGEEFTSQGLPVDNALELPLLPTSPVTVGQTWNTPRQRLDIPGVPVGLQPRVTLTNTLVDLEWEQGYPTAKIHQVFEAGEQGNLPKQIQFGVVPVTAPVVTFERDIYFAYTAGRLIKTVRTIKVTGRTTMQLESSAASRPARGAGMGPGGMGSGGMMPGMAPGMGRKGRGGMAPGGYGRQGGAPNSGGYNSGGAEGDESPGGFPGSGGYSGPPPGYPGSSSPPPGYPGSSSPPPGYPGGAQGRQGYPGAGGPGYPGAANSGGLSGPAGGAGAAQAPEHPVTLKAITETVLSKVTGP